MESASLLSSPTVTPAAPANRAMTNDAPPERLRAAAKTNQMCTSHGPCRHQSATQPTPQPPCPPKHPNPPSSLQPLVASPTVGHCVDTTPPLGKASGLGSYIVAALATCICTTILSTGLLAGAEQSTHLSRHSLNANLIVNCHGARRRSSPLLRPPHQPPRAPHQCQWSSCWRSDRVHPKKIKLLIHLAARATLHSIYAATPAYLIPPPLALRLIPSCST